MNIKSFRNILLFPALLVAATVLVLAEFKPAANAVSDDSQDAAGQKYSRSFFPNTEQLAANEMRITALGTGMPNVAYGSASASFLVELGNGDKFLFDFGNGAMNSLAALQVDYSETDKVFIGHLHTDHAGDLSILLIGGWFGSRHTPLHVYGPSALLPEHGIKAHTEHLMKAWDWDISSRAGGLPDAGGRIVAHEHDYSETAVIYDENGVQVTSFPAVHIRDGTVSYRLDWEGLSFVFSSDTEPNKWYLEQAKNADVAVHGTWPAAKAWAKISGQSEELANFVVNNVHTSPQAFGKIMSQVKPRLAVAYHYWNHRDIEFDVHAGILETYDGPLALAADMTVINVTPDHIEVRELSRDSTAWPRLPSEEYNAAPRTGLPTGLLSDWLKEGIRR